MEKLKSLVLVATIIGHNVSYAQTCNSNVVRSAPDSRYQLLNSNTEAKDLRTGLVWSRCSLGQSWTGSTCAGDVKAYTWKEATSAVNALGGNWRLPDIKELQSLVEEACYEPAINSTIFPLTLNGYWSASPISTGNESLMWRVYFYDGSAGDTGMSPSLYVRPVRYSQ